MKGYEYLKNFLIEEGFRHNEEDSFISFNFNGNAFFAYKSDSSFLSIFQICNTGEHSRNELLEKCNEMNDNYTIMKFTVQDERVICKYQFEPSKYTTSDDFVVILSTLDRVSDDFLQEISK